jgi:haloalkane dehalogenase
VRHMNRKHFLDLTAGVITSAALSACGTRGTRPSPAATPTGPIGETAFHSMRKFAELRFGRIAYMERGSGPAALFLHGFPLNGFQWRGALERLAPYRRCIAADFMGLGYTEIPDGQNLAPGQQVEMLAALLDRLSISAVDIVGNDSGGQVAQLFVARFPSRVRTLLLTNCEVANDSPTKSFLPVIAMSHAGTFVDQVLAPMVADKRVARSPKGIGRLAYVEPTNPTDEAVNCYFAPLVSSPRRKAQCEAYAIAQEQNPFAGIESALQRSRVPLRVVWGTGDTVFSPASADFLDHTFPRSRGIRRVEGAKAFFPEEMPDIIAEEARLLWGIV